MEQQEHDHKNQWTVCIAVIIKPKDTQVCNQNEAASHHIFTNQYDIKVIAKGETERSMETSNKFDDQITITQKMTRECMGSQKVNRSAYKQDISFALVHKEQ